MPTDAVFLISLLSATLLCSLVAGFLFAFAVVVMPGIKKLNDREYIRAFQVIDGVIQDNQWLFILVWVGSIVAILTLAAVAFNQPLVLIAMLAYILGVQLPTFTKNIPLNNNIQSLQIDSMEEAAVKMARVDFELRWNQWNTFRTLSASLVSALLMVLLYLH